MKRKSDSRRPNNASDPVNLVLNYSYGVLEGEVRRAINTVGLEPSIGWLHEFTGSQTRESAVYDLEPFRWIGDLTTIQALESGVLDLKDFYFTGDDYRYRFDAGAKRRFIDLLRQQFNSDLKYRSKMWKWDTIILSKTQELGRHMMNRANSLNFSDPSFRLERSDSLALRKRTLQLTKREAQDRGIGKSTLHYLRRRALGTEPSKTYHKPYWKSVVAVGEEVDR